MEIVSQLNVDFLTLRSGPRAKSAEEAYDILVKKNANKVKVGKDYFTGKIANKRRLAKDTSSSHTDSSDGAREQGCESHEPKIEKFTKT